jgi:hypothetical protein
VPTIGSKDLSCDVEETGFLVGVHGVTMALNKSPTMCKPQTSLPSIDSAAHKILAAGHP